MSTEENDETAKDAVYRLMEADMKLRRHLECHKHATRLSERIFSMTYGTTE